MARRDDCRRVGVSGEMVGLKMAIRKTIGVSHVLATAACLWGVLWAVASPSYWFEVRSVFIPDAARGNFIPMVVDREIHLPFTGEYRVEARNIIGNTIECEAHGKVDYRPDAELPEPLVLSWWAYSDTRCHDLPNGTYSVKTTWEVERLWGFIPDGKVVAVSNYFTVGEPE